MSRRTTKQRRAARRRERAFWQRVFPWRFTAKVVTVPAEQLTDAVGLVQGRSEVHP